MKNLVLAGLLAAAAANGKEVFRYEDEETGQVHYMSSLPDGAGVEGGWRFRAPEGEDFVVTYKAAKETGFVPSADHLPAMPVGPEDTADVAEAKQKFMAFYNNMPVDNYLPLAPLDTPEVQKARDSFLTFYKNMEQEQMAMAEAEGNIGEESAKDVVDLDYETIVELERRRRAPEEEAEALEELDDQLAVEARTADVEAVQVEAGQTKEKLAHFKSLTTPHYTYTPGYKSAEKMPFKYHPYFHFYRQHFDDKKEEDVEADAGAEVEKSPESVPFHPYHPYFRTQYYHSPYYHYNPYFYYNYHHKKPAEQMEQKEEEEEPAYPESDFYPFYMAKPTEEEIKEHQEKMKEYEETVKKEIEEYEAKRKEIMDEYADKMRAVADEMELPAHPFNSLEEEKAEEEQDGEGKTISLPVYYNSYFPRWRYTHFKKPAETEMTADSEVKEEVKGMSKRSAGQVFSAPATYLPTAVQVTKTVVKPLPAAKSAPSPPAAEVTAITASQPGVTYYPQVLPVFTRVHYPVIQYPTMVYPAATTYAAAAQGAAGELSASVGVEEVKNANVPASTTLLKAVPLKQAAAPPLPENVFPIFPKTDGHVEEQAALAL